MTNERLDAESEYTSGPTFASPAPGGLLRVLASRPEVTPVHTASQILSVLDRCCDSSAFPALDNGYVYPAATRLSLHRSEADWALAIEVFGFSPRVGLPDVLVCTFASRLHARDPPESYVTRQAYESYLATHPHDESRFFQPLEEATGRMPR